MWYSFRKWYSIKKEKNVVDQITSRNVSVCLGSASAPMQIGVKTLKIRAIQTIIRSLEKELVFT